MTTQTYNVQKDVVKNLRKVRDQISNEIKDMTFEQERAYLDKLLSEKQSSSLNGFASAGGDETQHQQQ